MSALITVQLDAVEVLAAELASLATELADEPAACHRSAADLESALAGRTGPVARATAATWGALIDAVAEQLAATAQTLSAAVASYRAADAGLGERIGLARPGLAVPR